MLAKADDSQGRSEVALRLNSVGTLWVDSFDCDWRYHFSASHLHNNSLRVLGRPVTKPAIVSQRGLLCVAASHSAGAALPHNLGHQYSDCSCPCAVNTGWCKPSVLTLIPGFDSQFWSYSVLDYRCFASRFLV